MIGVVRARNSAELGRLASGSRRRVANFIKSGLTTGVEAPFSNRQSQIDGQQNDMAQ